LSLLVVVLLFIVFFFQAEDGIRDATVTGVQTCALPISYGGGAVLTALAEHRQDQLSFSRAIVYYPVCRGIRPWKNATPVLMLLRSEERRVGKECRSWWSADH